MLTSFIAIVTFVVNYGDYIESTPLANPTKLAAVRSNNQFSLDLLKSLSTSNEDNIFFSPLSISAAVAMLSLGAGGTTLNEIDKAFHFDDVKKTSSNPDALHETFKKTLSVFEEINSTYTFRIDNYLVPSRDYVSGSVSKFWEDIDKYYHRAFPLWRFERSNADRMPRRYSRLPLLEICSFSFLKGKWKNQFSERNTKVMDFHFASNEKQSVKMMSMKETLPYAEDTEFNIQMLELPYAGNNLSMVIILPPLGDLSNLISKLTTEKLDNLLDQLTNRMVKVKFPKFKLEKEYSLKERLNQLGVHSIFDNSADFSEISNGKVKVSRIIHKTSIETNEEGTEAVGDTYITFMKRSSPLPHEISLEFVADRPFLFAIVDKRSSTNQLLYLGTFTRP